MKFHWVDRAGTMLLATSLLIFFATAGMAQQPATDTDTQEEEVELQQEALDGLKEMGEFLHTLTSFSVSSEIAMDEVLLTGQRILVTGTADITVQAPNRLRGASKIEEIHRDLEYYFNGEIFTLYGKNHNYYATVDAPETIVELLDIVQSRYNIELPMRDLFYWGDDTAEMDAIQSGFLVATTRVKGVSCKHYAFRQEDIDWQIWIEDSETPLPRKLVITSKQEVGQPQYSTTMTWNLSPKLSDGLFIFTPQSGAQKIDFEVYDDATETQN